MLLVTDASRFDDQGCRRFELQHNTSHACSNLLKKPAISFAKSSNFKKIPRRATTAIYTTCDIPNGALRETITRGALVMWSTGDAPWVVKTSAQYHG
jgi:hypothetical protein